LTLVIYAIFNWYLVILPHRSFILNEYAHTRVAKAIFYSFSIIPFDHQKRRKKKKKKDKSLVIKYRSPHVCVCVCTFVHIDLEKWSVYTK
jgi:hypothetical protein